MMSARRFGGLALVFVLAGARGGYAAMTLPEVLAQMEDKQRELQDVRFDFVQTVSQESLEQMTRGRVQAMKPRYLRVIQSEPAKQVVVTDGKTLWLYSPDQKQQLKGDWQAWLKQSRFPVILIDFIGTFTPERWKNQYDILFGGYEAGLYKLDLKPKQAGDPPLTLWILEDLFLPVRGELAEEGMRIRVDLKNVETNTGLTADVFSPRVPPGTERIPVTF